MKKAKEQYKRNKYESIDYNNEIDTADWYEKKTKKRVLLQTKRTGKVYYDRLGKIEY